MDAQPNMNGQRSWDDPFADARFHWEQPDPVVVAVAQKWRAAGVRRIHDLGCGAGRHMAFLLSEGFEVVGSDLSPRGLAVCARQLQQAGLRHDIVRANMSRQPFADCVFDAAVSINVLNHGPRAAVQAAADEIHRTLRPGGQVLLTVLNTWDWRFGSGEEPEPNTWVLADGPEAGIMHHFFDEEDLFRWLAAFEILHCERVRGLLQLSTAPGDRPVHRDAWQVLAERPPGV